MRHRELFTVFERHLASGNTVYYYRIYDEGGRRTTARNTGKTTRTAAKAYCRELIRQGRLIPSWNLTFAQYADGWWVYYRCRYIRSRLARGGSFSRTHAEIHRLNLNKHILQVFGKTKLKQITSREIKTWLFSFKNRGLSNVTANRCLANLRIMLNEAHRLEYIKRNPIKAVKPLKEVINSKTVDGM